MTDINTAVPLTAWPTGTLLLVAVPDPVLANKRYIQVVPPGLMPGGASGGGGGTAGVMTFNGRGGDVALTAGDVTAALAFTPYSAANPSGFQTAAQLQAAVANLVTATALTTALAGYVTTAQLASVQALIPTLPPAPTLASLGAYAASNPSGFQTSAQLQAAVANLVSAAALTAALAGYATTAQLAAAIAGLPAAPTLASLGGYAASNPSGFQTAAQVSTAIAAAGAGGGAAGVTTFNSRNGAITLTAADVSGALGFTAYNASNPLGFQTATQVAAATVANVSGTVAVANGGTGSTTAAGALAALGAYAAANPSGFQTAAQVTASIQAVVGAAPQALSTLAAIDAQLANDESAAAALTNTVAGKLAKSANLSDLASAATARTNLGLAAVAASGSYADLTNPPAAYTLPAATTGTLGGVRPDGTTITIAGGVISSVATPATVPVATIAASGASQALAAPASGSKAFDITLTANCALSLSGGTAGQQQTITVYLRQDATAGRVPTLPAGVKWPGGTAPTPNSAAGVIDVFHFVTPDAGTTWFGSY